MKVILVYDITNNSVLNKVRKTVSKYLRHIQYSVFEGELEEYEIKALEIELKALIDLELDSIIIFKFNYYKEENKKIIGFNKNEFNGMII